jgi:hypothetical protein
LKIKVEGNSLLLGEKCREFLGIVQRTFLNVVEKKGIKNFNLPTPVIMVRFNFFNLKKKMERRTKKKKS